MICRHCQKAAVSRPRGLCWSCYYTPAVRERFPSTSKYARRGTGLFNHRGKLPAVPTTAPPLTAEKIQVMSDRAARGEFLFHPNDAT